MLDVPLPMSCETAGAYALRVKVEGYINCSEHIHPDYLPLFIDLMRQLVKTKDEYFISDFGILFVKEGFYNNYQSFLQHAFIAIQKQAHRDEHDEDWKYKLPERRYHDGHQIQ